MPRPEDEFDDDFAEEDDDDLDDCGMMMNGQCTLAGTEWCDWECPRNRPVRKKAGAPDAQ